MVAEVGHSSAKVLRVHCATFTEARVWPVDPRSSPRRRNGGRDVSARGRELLRFGWRTAPVPAATWSRRAARFDSVQFKVNSAGFSNTHSLSAA